MGANNLSYSQEYYAACSLPFRPELVSNITKCCGKETVYQDDKNCRMYCTVHMQNQDAWKSCIASPTNIVCQSPQVNGTEDKTINETTPGPGSGDKKSGSDKGVKVSLTGFLFASLFFVTIIFGT
jgi:hypothetical protein